MKIAVISICPSGIITASKGVKKITPFLLKEKFNLYIEMRKTSDKNNPFTFDMDFDLIITLCDEEVDIANISNQNLYSATLKDAIANPKSLVKKALASLQNKA